MANKKYILKLTKKEYEALLHCIARGQVDIENEVDASSNKRWEIVESLIFEEIKPKKN